MAAPRADERPLVGWTFRLSLLALALWGLVRFWIDFPPAELWRGDPHQPLRARIATAPLFLAAFMGLLWFGVYRPHGTGARPVALAIGLGMAAMGAVHLLVGSTGAVRPELPALLLGVGAAHVGWGLFGQRV
jgi:hypothetical protein